VVAPYDGSVVRVPANHAEFVGPGSPLIEIVERGSLHVEALVQSTWLTWLKPGQRFTIAIDELGSEVVAEVTAMGARVDPVSQTIAITGKIIKSARACVPA
jgi:membrane fusion protein (multidrug efflux system)